ncbi:MAG: YaiO family outer membrane beta-barrel protein [Acidobacteriia bacterium]|nr:YaiO family outer membrane beta-barrel protein [Terriglobia bacterium]
MLKNLNNSRSKSFALLLLLLAALVYALPAVADDEVSRARALAFSGAEHRAEALSLLQTRLAKVPDDGDALTLYGTILSWEGRYDESRQALQKVLDRNPDHADALPAMLNLELWSNHPDRAEQLAEGALQRHPGDPALLMFLARAQRNRNHEKQSAQTLDQLLKIQPSNQEAKEMRRRMVGQARKWEASYDFTYNWFSSVFDSQKESTVSLRGQTSLGSVIGRLARADRFGDHSTQISGEFYPHIRPGTYAFLTVGGSPDAVLYPEYFVGADLYQSAGHGFEASAGYRRLQFSDDVNIFTAALYKYYGNWLYSGRIYLTPDDLGVSKTGVFAARRFFGDEGIHDYLEFRFSYGASKALATSTLDLISLNSTRYTVSYDKRIGNWDAAVSLGAGSEDQQFGGKVNRYTVEGSIYYRF